MADDAYDDDLFDDVYAGDDSSAPAPAPPKQFIKNEPPTAHHDDDSLYARQPTSQEAPYASDTGNQIAAVDTGNEGHGGAYDSHVVKTERFHDEDVHNGDDGYPPIGIKEDG